MPAKPILEGEGVPSAEAEVFDAFHEFIVNAHYATIAQTWRGRNKFSYATNIEHPPGESREECARSVARVLIEAAEAHAEERGKKGRYAVALFGASSDARQRPRLADVTVTVGEELDDDDHNPTAVKASARLIADTGDRYVKLLDQSVMMIEKLVPMADARLRADASVIATEAEYRFKTRELELNHNAAREDKQAEHEATIAMWGTIESVSTRHAGLINAIGEMLGAKAAEIRANIDKGRAKRKRAKKKTARKSSGTSAGRSTLR